MRASELIPLRQGLLQLECPWCEGRMWLSSIEPDEPEHDRRTFECSECKNVTVQVVKYR